jgi:hypothetical protein
MDPTHASTVDPFQSQRYLLHKRLEPWAPCWTQESHGCPHAGLARAGIPPPDSAPPGSAAAATATMHHGAAAGDRRPRFRP